MENKPSFVLYVEERIVFLYHLGKVMRKDKKGGAEVCRIICHHLFSAGCNTCEVKTVFHPLRRGMRMRYLVLTPSMPLAPIDKVPSAVDKMRAVERCCVRRSRWRFDIS